MLFTHCGVYSFTGASISPSIKTVLITYFPNKANIIQPTLSHTFTEKLKDIFIEQTNLTLKEQESDLNFSGYIKNYQIKPIAIQSNETAAQNRLTISIFVSFKNNIDTSKNFEEVFTRYKDYESSENLNEIEEILINEITNEITEDVFNKAIVNW